MFPGIQDFFDAMCRPRPPKTKWQKFCDFVRHDLVMYAVVSFFGVMFVVGLCSTGLFFIRWLYS